MEKKNPNKPLKTVKEKNIYNKYKINIKKIKINIYTCIYSDLLVFWLVKIINTDLSILERRYVM